MRTNFLILILFWLATGPSLARAETRDAQYGIWESYSLTGVLKYPDFELRFTGSERGSFFPGSTTHRMGDIYKFRITTKDTQQNLSWSSGTGNIAPISFEIGGESYILEMSSSYIFDGFVSKDKVMLWRKPEWQRRMR